MSIRFVVAGVLAVGMVAVVQAQRQPGGFGGFGGPTQLIANKEVQAELKLSEEEITKVKDWAKDYGQKTFKTFGEKFKDLPKDQEERAAKMAEIRAEMTKDAYKQLGEVLKKDQLARLKQIDRQNMGVAAFTDAEVVAALKLTDSQKTSVKGISGDFQKERREIFADVFGGGKGKFDAEKFADANKKSQKLQKEYIGKVIDVLEDSQKATWKELTGAAFDTAKLQPTFGKKKQD